MHRIVARLALLVVCFAVLAPGSRAQDAQASHRHDRAAEVLRPEVPVRLREGDVFLDLVAVKFIEGHAVRLGGSGLTSRTLDLRGARAALGTRPVWRMLTRSVEAVDRDTVELRRRSGMNLADMNNYYFVETAGKADSEALLNALLADPSIETAYAEPIPVRTGDIAPPTPTFASTQVFMDAAPAGLGHWLTREIDGAQGAPGQVVAQLEGAWTLDHEDADELILANVVGVRNFGGLGIPWSYHGTACFGLLNASRNAWGVCGFAPLAAGRVSSFLNGSANMIDLSADLSVPGDVFSSSFAYALGTLHVPLDNQQANFDAIRRAVAKGICYTLSAGNTGADLATISPRYLPTAPDSGAFIIGGTDAGNRTRAAGSNWGAKVVANGWYSQVPTLSYGDLFFPGGDARQAYTGAFGGTSAAAPQVAGVLASLQGASIQQNGVALSVARVRSLLTTHGTTISGSQNIGLRPDMVKLMVAAGVLDGLRSAREASVGGTYDLEVTVAAGRTWTVFGAAGRGRADLGFNRRILLDSGSLFVLTAGRGSATQTFAVPNVPALRGLSVFLQMLDTDGSRYHVSNSLEAYVR